MTMLDASKTNGNRTNGTDRHVHRIKRSAFPAETSRQTPSTQNVTDDLGEDVFPGAYGMVGRSAAIQEVCKAIVRVAPLDVTVLITGESGTGKELVARAVYENSDRRGKRFVDINCAAIPETLLESELFGHERGAFTGADRRRVGKFEQADGGTIFLDEVGDLSSPAQAKVLRLLQEQQFYRIGGNDTVLTDVRVIAATNRDLEAPEASARFRRELYYRLNVFRIHLPPLRDRLQDLPLLVDYFVRRFARELERRPCRVAAETMRLLEEYQWPGNVRELQGVIKYALVMADGDVLRPDDLPHQFRRAASANGRLSEPSAQRDNVVRYVRKLLSDGETDIYQKVSEEVSRIALEEVLRHVDGNQVQASQRLGISRTTLRSKIRSFGLRVGKRLSLESNGAD